jgi:hypothetical protein
VKTYRVRPGEVSKSLAGLSFIDAFHFNRAAVFGQNKTSGIVWQKVMRSPF